MQNFTVAEERVKTWEEMTERERYEMLCRGEVSIPLEVEKNLKCRYVDRGIPFLKIAPFKEEEAYLDPRIVVYHNVIYDEEIETIKRMAQPRVNMLGHVARAGCLLLKIISAETKISLGVSPSFEQRVSRRA